MTSRGRSGPVVWTALVALIAAALAVIVGVAWIVFSGDGRKLKSPGSRAAAAVARMVWICATADSASAGAPQSMLDSANRDNYCNGRQRIPGVVIAQRHLPFRVFS